MNKPDAIVVQRLAKSDEHPFVAELQQGDHRQTHHFGDSHSRTEFVSGVLSLGRLLGLRIVEVQR